MENYYKVTFFSKLEAFSKINNINIWIPLLYKDLKLENFKGILGVIRSDFMGEKYSNYDEFKGFINKIVERAFKINKFYYHDLIDGMFFYIDNQKREKSKSSLEYFLRGNIEPEKLTEIKSQKVFLGVMGGYHIYSRLKEELKKHDNLEEYKILKDKINKLLKELINLTIEGLEEKGSIKELLHLNECTENDGFYTVEVTKIDEYTERVWLSDNK